MNEIFQEVANELNIPVEQVKDIYKFKQRWLKHNLKKKHYLQILDTGLGTYSLNFKKLNTKIINLVRREKKGKPINHKILNQLNELRVRLHNYNINRKRKQEKRELCTV